MNSANIKASSSTTSRNYNPTMTTSLNPNNEKLMRENLNLVIGKIELINDSRIQIAKNIKLIEHSSKKFYEDAKVIFKNLKTLRNKKNEEELKTNLLDDNILKNQLIPDATSQIDDRKYNSHQNFYSTNDDLREKKRPQSNRNIPPRDSLKTNFRTKSSNIFCNINIYRS